MARPYPDLDEIAERFDALYTDLTALQRALIDATRNGVDHNQARELARRAEVHLAAARAADNALGITVLNTQAVEAAALRARLLDGPIDEHLLSAVLSAQTRSYAYALLADVIDRARDDKQLIDAVGGRELAEYLAMPRGLGTHTAHRLAEHYSLDPQAPLAQLSDDDLDRLDQALRDSADALPEELRPRGRAVQGPPNGIGAGRVVLDAWIDALTPPSETAREEAARVSRRDGWPPDAVDVAQRLLTFSLDVLAPALIPTWDRILGVDASDRIATMRAEQTAWRESLRNTDDEGAEIAWYALNRLIAGATAADRAERLAELPEGQWGSGQPLALSRTVARRCGEVLAMIERDAAEDLLEQLP